MKLAGVQMHETLVIIGFHLLSVRVTTTAHKCLDTFILAKQKAAHSLMHAYTYTYKSWHGALGHSCVKKNLAIAN